MGIRYDILEAYKTTLEQISTANSYNTDPTVSLVYKQPASVTQFPFICIHAVPSDVEYRSNKQFTQRLAVNIIGYVKPTEDITEQHLQTTAQEELLLDIKRALSEDLYLGLTGATKDQIDEEVRILQDDIDVDAHQKKIYGIVIVNTTIQYFEDIYPSPIVSYQPDPTWPVRLSLLKAYQNSLEQISTANGYNNDIQDVSLNYKQLVDINSFPSICVVPVVAPIAYQPNRQINQRLQVLVYGYIKAGKDFSEQGLLTQQQENLVADIIRALTRDTHLGLTGPVRFKIKRDVRLEQIGTTTDYDKRRRLTSGVVIVNTSIEYFHQIHPFETVSVFLSDVENNLITDVDEDNIAVFV